MAKIMQCRVNGKDGYKNGDHGWCYTYNDNDKSRRKAFELAYQNSEINDKHSTTEESHA